MMSQNPYNVFLGLVAFDNTLHEYEEKIQQLEQKKQELLAKKEDLSAVINQLKQDERNLKKEVDMHELHMKELDAKERLRKEELDDINTPKEYTAAKREIEAIQRNQHEHERVLMHAWNALENVHKTCEHKEHELHDATSSIDAELATIQEQEEKLRAEYTQKLDERDLKVTGVPEEWLEKYQAMRDRVTDPVVPVQQGSCSACFFDIPDQKLLSLKRHALLQCEGCYRFLYMPDNKETSQSEETQN